SGIRILAGVETATQQLDWSAGARGAVRRTAQGDAARPTGSLAARPGEHSSTILLRDSSPGAASAPPAEAFEDVTDFARTFTTDEEERSARPAPVAEPAPVVEPAPVAERERAGAKWERTLALEPEEEARAAQRPVAPFRSGSPVEVVEPPRAAPRPVAERPAP